MRLRSAAAIWARLKKGTGALVVGGDVGERVPPGEQVGEGDGRAAGRVEEALEAAAVVGEHALADVSQRGCVLLHQRVVGVLAE